MTGLPVVNLAQAGATVEGAIVQAEGITEPDSFVIVEVGGNDLLRGADASVFGRELDALVSSLCSGGHQTLVVELPLFPFKNGFGRAQRGVVARYGAAMLPKRCFTRVLGAKGATLDGLHLSQEGHDAIARIMAGVIREE
jgi:lysophospholipase L1-like esterase